MAKKKARVNIYTHKIDLIDLTIKNSEYADFQRQLEDIPYRGYKVEDLSDGRQIVITKPGGKFGGFGGPLKREDFMVWILKPQDGTLWLISHKNIFEDLEAKAEQDSKATLRIIEAFERVFSGEEPDSVIAKMKLANPCGESPEVLLKAYKWIWGQEDCNYPQPKYEGRQMSMKEIRKLADKIRC